MRIKSEVDFWSGVVFIVWAWRLQSVPLNIDLEHPHGPGLVIFRSGLDCCWPLWASSS